MRDVRLGERQVLLWRDLGRKLPLRHMRARPQPQPQSGVTLWEATTAEPRRPHLLLGNVQVRRRGRRGLLRVQPDANGRHHCVRTPAGQVHDLQWVLLLADLLRTAHPGLSSGLGRLAGVSLALPLWPALPRAQWQVRELGQRLVALAQPARAVTAVFEWYMVFVTDPSHHKFAVKRCLRD